MNNIHFVSYVDGSCSPNPGYGGYGIFGYTYKNVDKPKNYKHPLHNLYFTSKGILKEKVNNEKIEVLRIVEYIEALGGNRVTNNEAELKSVLKSLEISSTLENIKTVTIFTDSNYVSNCFNESIHIWRQNNWKRRDGLPIIHLDLWLKIDDYVNTLKSKNIEVNIKWVKGHNGDYGNETSDLFSVIASNASRIEQKTTSTIVLNKMTTYSDYKSSFVEKDFIYFFRDLYFSSDSIDDTNYCFIATSKENNDLGKRDNTSIFALVEGYIPPIVNKLKSFYRSIKRPHTVSCCMKLIRFTDKELLRLIKLIDTRYLLVKELGNNAYSFVKDNNLFLLENDLKYPFTILASRQFNKLQNIIKDLKDIRYKIYDITSYLIENKKLSINNQVENIDITKEIEKDFHITQRILLKIGYDLPNYLALKAIEKDIEKVELILEYDSNTNFFSAYIRITTSNRNIICTNISNKYLVK